MSKSVTFLGSFEDRIGAGNDNADADQDQPDQSGAVLLTRWVRWGIGIGVDVARG